MPETYQFDYVEMKQEIVTALKNELPKFNFQSVKVLKADPQTPAELPCIGVNRVDDSESEQSLADYSGAIYNQGTGVNETFHGTFFSEAVEVRIWHTNADERDKLYHTVKAILFAIRKDLVAKGVLNIQLRGGRDEQDSSQQHAPIVLYWSTITMSYLNPLDVAFTEDVPIIAVTDVRAK